jgi:hypothetical protein
MKSILTSIFRELLVFTPTVIGALFLLLSFAALAAPKKPSFTISIGGISNHPLQEMMSQIYGELGFDVSYINVPIKRGLLLLNEGKVDADLIRLKSTIETYPNVLMISVPIQFGSIALICKPDIPCQESVLYDQKATIVTHQGLLNNLPNYSIHANLKTIEVWSSIVGMVQSGREQYAIITMNEANLENHKEHFNIYVLSELAAYHVVHKRHADLVSKIEEKIREGMNKFNNIK